jgi:hypothetical protein
VLLDWVGLSINTALRPVRRISTDPLPVLWATDQDDRRETSYLSLGTQAAKSASGKKKNTGMALDN